jgi:hypothetical protein
MAPSEIDRFAVGAGVGLFLLGANIGKISHVIVHVSCSAQSDHQSHWQLAKNLYITH